MARYGGQGCTWTTWQGPKEAWGAKATTAQDNTVASLDFPVAAALEQVKLCVFQRRIRVRDYFVDSDKLRCGRCTAQQFTRALGQIHSNMRPEDIAGLVEHFTERGEQVQPPQVVGYAKFCAVVDEVFGASNLETKPATRVQPPGMPPRLGLTTAEADGARLEDVLHRMASLMKLRGIDVRACLRANARPGCEARCGKVSPAAFIKQLPVAQAFKDSELKLVIQHYSTEGGAVDVFALERDIGGIQGEGSARQRPPGVSMARSSSASRASSKESQSELHRPGSAESSMLSDDLGESQPPRRAAAPSAAQRRPSSANAPRMRLGGVAGYSQQDLRRSRPDALVRLQEAVATRRLRLRETFKEVDRLRRGTCSLHQLRVAMTTLHLDLDADEVDELYDRYRTGDGSFGYRGLCDAVDEALRTQPPAAVRGVKALQEPRQMAEAGQLPAVIAARMRQRGVEAVHLVDAFSAANCTMVNHVNQHQFARILDRFGLRLTDEQLTMLHQAFCDTETGSEVNYRDFCMAIERCSAGAGTVARGGAAAPGGGEQGSRPPRAPSASRRPAPGKYFDAHGNVVPLSSVADQGTRGSLPRGVQTRQMCKAR